MSNLNIVFDEEKMTPERRIELDKIVNQVLNIDIDQKIPKTQTKLSELEKDYLYSESVNVIDKGDYYLMFQVGMN